MIDWSKLTKAQFKAEEAKLLAPRHTPREPRPSAESELMSDADCERVEAEIAADADRRRQAMQDQKAAVMCQPTAADL